MDFRRPYTARWRVMRVDEDTWQGISELSGAVSATVSRDCTDSVPLLESASIEVDLDAAFEEGYYRIEAICTQDGGAEVVPIATLLLSEGPGKLNRGIRTASLDGTSVLQPAADERFDHGSYAPKGADGAMVAARILSSVCKAPVETVGRFTLSDNIVYDLGASYLEGVWAILNSAGWCIRISEDGTIRICEKPSRPADDAPVIAPDIIFPEIGTEPSYSSVPNVYIAIDGEQRAEAVNDDPASRTSTVARGRRIVTVDTSPSKVNGESLPAYARRRLAELRTITSVKYSYKREYHPGIVPFDVLLAQIPGYGIDGQFRVMSQTVTLAQGITIDEKSGIEEVA